MKPSAMSFFHKLALKADLSAQEDPARWQTLKDFQLNKKCVKSLPVVNDGVERAVKLTQGLNIYRSIGEEQKQNLLLFISIHRAKYQESRKFLLVGDDIPMY